MSTKSNNTDNTKVFVGNVPYQCSLEDFIECFKEYDGFVRADIKRKQDSDKSRGFGFVEFDTPENANKLLELERVELLDRELRVYPYNARTDRGYTVFIKDLPNGFNHTKLKSVLEKFGEVSNCYTNRGNGVATFVTPQAYYRSLEYGDEVGLNIVQHKRRVPNNRFTDPETAYKQGFEAGKLVGFQDGFQKGLEQAKLLDQK